MDHGQLVTILWSSRYSVDDSSCCRFSADRLWICI